MWIKALARGADLELVVEDAGPGVPAELAGTIFEAFRRGEGPAPTMAHARGAGTGLSLVARFAHLHGGHAWVDERRGGAAAFHVLLPDVVSYMSGYAQWMPEGRTEQYPGEAQERSAEAAILSS